MLFVTFVQSRGLHSFFAVLRLSPTFIPFAITIVMDSHVACIDVLRMIKMCSKRIAPFCQRMKLFMKELELFPSKLWVPLKTSSYKYRMFVKLEKGLLEKERRGSSLKLIYFCYEEDKFLKSFFIFCNESIVPHHNLHPARNRNRKGTIKNSQRREYNWMKVISFFQRKTEGPWALCAFRWIQYWLGKMARNPEAVDVC